MGKKIDRFVLTSMLAVCVFFYFDTVFVNRKLAVLISLFSCVLISKLLQCFRKLLIKTPWHQKRRLLRKAGGALMHLACMEGDEAHARVCELIRNSYHTDASIELEQLHPSLQLSPNRVFELWRSHQGAQELVICTTGSCTSETRILAESLKQPKVALLEAEKLSQLIAEHPKGFYPTSEEKKLHKLHLKQFAALIFNRRNAPRCILFSFSLLLMYVFSGNIYYLVFSMALLFVALSSFRHPVRPAKLF